MQVSGVPALTIEKAVAGFLAAQDELSFVQVGGFDGVSFDPVRPHIASGKLSGLIIEPIPEYFAKLRALYAESDRIRVCNCAIDAEEGNRTMWRFMPSAIETGILSPHFAGISSLMMDDLLNDDGSIGRLFDEKQRALLRTLVEPIAVRCRKLEDVLAEYDISRVDLLQIDTEGYDFKILKLFDFSRFRPAIVHYETMHLSGDEQQRAESMLGTLGYRTYRQGHDTLAVRGVFLVSGSFEPAPILALGGALHDDGRVQDALTLYEHILSIEPENHVALAGAMRCLSSTGRVKEALRRLIMLQRLTGNGDALRHDVHEQACLAIDIYNRHVQAGDLAEAREYVAALVALVPGNQSFLQQAFILAQRLGLREQTAEYAAALLKLDPSHYAARCEMASFCQIQGDTRAETEHLICLARFQPDDLHTAVRLHNIYIALCAVLVDELDDNAVTLIKDLIAAARAVPPGQSAAADEHYARAETHYRLAIDAIDLPAILEPTPEPYPYPAIAFATSAGRAIDLPGVRAAAVRLRAEVVFFVAADAAYVDLYGRPYVSSVLRSCDVGCLVIVHVIGGVGRLNQVTEAIGIVDERLIFAGDDFDPAGIQCRCFAEPQGNWSGFAAHYQSARFLWLGHLLQEIGLPVLVSDIDLLMQRGVKDLLERCAGADVVFNENAICRLYGGRLTANLLLVNPTPVGMLFTCFLRRYLDRALQRSQVTRWIDQCALLSARHHVAWTAEPRLEYFDTRLDINNIMFKEYKETPFRFLSLYHGFDMSSLSRNMSCQKESASEPVA